MYSKGWWSTTSIGSMKIKIQKNGKSNCSNNKQGRDKQEKSKICNKKTQKRDNLQDGGPVRRGDQLPPQKYIKNASTCGTTPSEHLLNAGRRPQTSKKAS